MLLGTGDLKFLSWSQIANLLITVSSFALGKLANLGACMGMGMGKGPELPSGSETIRVSAVRASAVTHRCRCARRMDRRDSARHVACGAGCSTCIRAEEAVGRRDHTSDAGA